MQRSRDRLVAALAVAAFACTVSASCALDEGEPWAEATFGLQASFDDDGRRSEGRYATAKDYAVELDALALEVGAMSVGIGATGGATFDPADPPEGYSLCHNGHCHADSGELVDYEDIAIEISQGNGGQEITATLESELPLLQGSTAIGECADLACVLPRGTIGVGRLVVRTVTLRGRAFDRRRGEAARLPEEGVPFDWELPVEATLAASLDREIGKELGGAITIEGDLVVTARLLDAIEFEMADETNLSPAVARELEDSSRWSVRVTNTN